MIRLPPWANAHDTKPYPRIDVAKAVLLICTEVRQKPVNPDRCGTDAKPILALWRALGKPDPVEFVADFALVSRWARESPDPMAARDIRAEGWIGGTDRHRDVTTLARQDRWQTRLDAAQEWSAKAVTPEPESGAPAVPVAHASWEDRDLLCQIADRGDAIQVSDSRDRLRLMRLLKVMGGRDYIRSRRKDEKAFIAKWDAVYPQVLASIAADLAKPVPTPEATP